MKLPVAVGDQLNLTRNGYMIENLNKLINETNEAYHEQAKDNLSSGQLVSADECLALYKKKKDGLVPSRESAAMTFGTNFHCAVLEPDRFDRDYILSSAGPVNPTTRKQFGPSSQQYKDWLQRMGPSKVVISEKDYDMIKEMQKSVQEHPIAGPMLKRGVAEKVARCQYFGMPCQARFDWVTPEGDLVDLKSSADLKWFFSDAKKLKYDRKMSFYKSVLEGFLQEEIKRVYLIAVEKKEPYRCGVFEITKKALRLANECNVKAIERIKACQESGVWPTGFEEVRKLDFEY